jgi:hypothetical protein
MAHEILEGHLFVRESNENATQTTDQGLPALFNFNESDRHPTFGKLDAVAVIISERSRSKGSTSILFCIFYAQFYFFHHAWTLE